MTWGVGGGPVVNGLALSTGVRLSAHTTRPSCGPGSSGVRDWVHLASPAADVEYWDPATRELQVRVSGGRMSAGGYVSSLTTTLFAVVVP